jgi:hypothetical protein
MLYNYKIKQRVAKHAIEMKSDSFDQHEPWNTDNDGWHYRHGRDALARLSQPRTTRYVDNIKSQMSICWRIINGILIYRKLSSKWPLMPSRRTCLLEAAHEKRTQRHRQLFLSR